MEIALKEPTLMKSVEQWAKETKRPVEKVLEVAVQTYFDDMEAEAIRSETEVFWSMHEELLKTYPNQYVALCHGAVVDHDQDILSLEKRIRDRFGLLPVLIAPVNSPPPRELKWLGGRIDTSDALS